MINDLIGKPFVDHGRGPDGYDCWGLVREVYRRYGIDLPDYSISAAACERVQGEIEEAKKSEQWVELEKPEVPCVMVIKSHPVFHNHLGVYVGKGRFLHVSTTKSVVVERISSPAWRRLIRGYWQYVA